MAIRGKRPQIDELAGEPNPTRFAYVDASFRLSREAARRENFAYIGPAWSYKAY